MDTSNWLDKNKRIMVGGKPYNDDDLKYFYDNDITVFVNLTSNLELKSKQNFKYHLKLPSDVQFIHFPIKDMSVENDDLTLELVDKIINLSKTHIIYIHCKGGHGRAGVVSGLIVHKLYPEMTYTEVLEYIQKQHRTRKVKPYLSTPQTANQFNQLYRLINKSQDIFFYNKQSPTYVFSNFYSHPKSIPLFIDDEKREWFSSEAYYQAHKFIGTSSDGNKYAELIRITTSSHFAYLLGNMGGNIRPSWNINGVSIKDIIKSYKMNTELKLREDWDNVKEDIMRQALRYKFTQNVALRESLINSGTNRLVEYTPKDLYWGTFWDKKGKNRLGILLESIRDELRLDVKR